MNRPGKILIGRIGHGRMRLIKGKWLPKGKHGRIQGATKWGQRLHVREAKGL